MTTIPTKELSLNFVEDRAIYIYGGFDDSILKYVMPEFSKIVAEEAKKKDGTVKINIDSGGGYIYVLKNMLSIVEFAKKEDVIVETRVLAEAYSCASMLAASGTKGHRYIGEHAEHLAHLGWASTGNVRNDVELERTTARVAAHFNFIRAMYKKYANIKNLEKVIHDDMHFIRGKNIIKNGLADKFIGS